MSHITPTRRPHRLAVVACLSLAFCFATSASAKDWFVDDSGNNNNAGTDAKPFKTIQKGVDKAQPGDRVIVKNGTYYEDVYSKRSGNSSKWIEIKAKNRHQAKIISNQRYTFYLSHNYIKLNGFDIKNTFNEWYDSTGVTVENAHNIKIVHNKIHDCGGGGIEAKFSDALTIQRNKIWNNTKTSTYQASGISIYQPQRRSGGDWSIKVRYNKVHDNSHTVKNPYTGTVSDGNGIIIDNTKGVDQSEDFGVAGKGNLYDKWILVDSNMCWNNGGAGVTAYLSTKVLFRNNSTRNNVRVPETGAAEIVIGDCENVQVINNAMYANKNYATMEYWSNNVQWSNNCIYGGDNAWGEATLWNTVWKDPQFKSATDLHIKSTSPCKKKGTKDWGVNNEDIDGQNRVQNGIDIGADEIN